MPHSLELQFDVFPCCIQVQHTRIGKTQWDVQEFSLLPYQQHLSGKPAVELSKPYCLGYLASLAKFQTRH